jgi:tetratricopeptide (TPR) repeat protein
MSGLDPEIQLPITLSLDNHSGPAARIPEERLQSMVAAALVEFDRIHPGQNADSSSQLAGKRLPAPTSWMVAAGAAIALIGGAAAVHYLVATPEAKQVPTAASVQAPLTTPPTALPTVPPSAADAREDTGDLDVAPTAAAGDESGSSTRGADRGRHALARSASAPEDLLQKANQLRAAGRFGDAAETYSLVYDRFPRTQAAYVARVAAAALELEHLSNALKARRLFEQALQDRPKGALDLEARQGLSVALRDLEDRTGEREALRALIAHHPGSPAARRAQVRLTELGGE